MEESNYDVCIQVFHFTAQDCDSNGGPDNSVIPHLCWSLDNHVASHETQCESWWRGHGLRVRI